MRTTRGNFRPLGLYLSGCALLLLAGRSASAFQEPEGFGDAKFGMKESQVQALYPTMQPVATPAAKESQALPFRLSAYRLDDQSIGSLNHCSAQIRFLDGEMFDVQFQCPDKEAVTKYLDQTFGPPTQINDGKGGKNRIWKGQHGLVSHLTNTGSFMLGDLARTDRLNWQLMALMFKGGAPATPEGHTAPPTPAH